MADHYVGILRGRPGFKESQLTTGTSSTATLDIELRVEDSVGVTNKDVLLALEAFKRYFTSRKMNAIFPVVN